MATYLMTKTPKSLEDEMQFFLLILLLHYITLNSIYSYIPKCKTSMERTLCANTLEIITFSLDVYLIQYLPF